MPLPGFVNLLSGNIGKDSTSRHAGGKPRYVGSVTISSRATVLVVVLLASASLAAALLPRKLRPALHRRPQQLIVRDDNGQPSLTCSASRGPVGRVCLATEIWHNAAATNASRAHTGSPGALKAFLPGTSQRLPDPVAVTFYDDPITLAGGNAPTGHEDKECSDLTPSDGAPTVFAARDNPSLYHLLRVQLLPIFLALASFGLQDGTFQLVFTDGRPRDWSTYVFDDASSHPAQLLHEMPRCFSVRRAVLGVRYDNFGISAHYAATAAETEAGRPQLTAFSAWLLRRFGAGHSAAPALFAAEPGPPGVPVAPGERPAAEGSRAVRDAQRTDDAAQGAKPAGGGSSEPAASAQAAFARPGDSYACERLRSLPQRPLLTLLLRTLKHNGNGRRLSGAEHLVRAAEACGFATAQLDLAALPFAEQLQAVANSSVFMGVHGAGLTFLLALPPWGVSVELQPYKFDASAMYYHVFGNWAAAAGRTHLVWHNTNPWHASAGVARVDDYKSHDTRMVQFEAERIVAAAAAALSAPLTQRNFDEPVLLNAAVLRCNYSHVMGNLKDDCAAVVHSKRG